LPTVFIQPKISSTPFSQALTDGVARMAGGSAVDGRIPELMKTNLA
jgi:hypothetical protein